MREGVKAMETFFKRLRDWVLLLGVFFTIGLAVYLWVAPEPEPEDECVVQEVGGVEMSRCLTHGVAYNRNEFPVRMYVGMIYRDSYGDPHEMGIGVISLGEGEEKWVSVLMQSDRYSIYVYDRSDHLLGSYTPLKSKFEQNGQRKIPL